MELGQLGLSTLSFFFQPTRVSHLFIRSAIVSMRGTLALLFAAAFLAIAVPANASNVTQTLVANITLHYPSNAGTVSVGYNGTHYVMVESSVYAGDSHWNATAFIYDKSWNELGHYDLPVCGGGLCRLGQVQLFPGYLYILSYDNNYFYKVYQNGTGDSDAGWGIWWPGPNATYSFSGWTLNGVTWHSSPGDSGPFVLYTPTDNLYQYDYYSVRHPGNGTLTPAMTWTDWNNWGMPAGEPGGVFAHCWNGTHFFATSNDYPATAIVVHDTSYNKKQFYEVDSLNGSECFAGEQGIYFFNGFVSYWIPQTTVELWLTFMYPTPPTTTTTLPTTPGMIVVCDINNLKPGYMGLGAIPAGFVCGGINMLFNIPILFALVILGMVGIWYWRKLRGGT
jgi:hypothetical protein